MTGFIARAFSNTAKGYNVNKGIRRFFPRMPNSVFVETILTVGLSFFDNDHQKVYLQIESTIL